MAELVHDRPRRVVVFVESLQGNVFTMQIGIVDPDERQGIALKFVMGAGAPVAR